MPKSGIVTRVGDLSSLLVAAAVSAAADAADNDMIAYRCLQVRSSRRTKIGRKFRWVGPPCVKKFAFKESASCLIP